MALRDSAPWGPFHYMSKVFKEIIVAILLLGLLIALIDRAVNWISSNSDTLVYAGYILSAFLLGGLALGSNYIWKRMNQ